MDLYIILQDYVFIVVFLCFLKLSSFQTSFESYFLCPSGMLLVTSEKRKLTMGTLVR
jgi:hypothetical protein